MDGLTVDGILGPHGALSAALRSYEERPQQLTLARAVNEALTRGRILLAEAGTGTGKTLAYLVPAVLSGKRVIVSTATRTLQEQVFQRDIPLLRDQVGLKFEAALLKGRSNYLCALRFEAFEQAPTFDTPAEAAHWPAFRDWAYRTEDGDRGTSAIPDTWEAWGRVSTNAEGCLGSKCPHLEACFVGRARARAQESQVVVVNHALFFADLALRARSAGDRELRVLPPADAVVFDEAHTLEDVATEFFGLSTSSARLVGLSRDATDALPPLDPRSPPVVALGLQLKQQAETFFGEVAVELALRDGGDARLSPGRLGHSAGAGQLLQETLSALSALCPEDDEDLGPLLRRCDEAQAALEATLRADDATQVYWAQARGRTISLRAAPIDVGETLARHLYPSVGSVIFTSATLTTARGREAPDFTFLVERLGLAPGSWDGVRVDSPFDYPTQAGLYLPRDLPPPSDPGWTRAFAREVYRALRLTKGRAFVLFTSLKQLDEVHALVAPHLDVPALKQGDAPRQQLIDSFRAEPSVLFASQSFWEGVDVPGDALSLVIMDKLPFAPPNDPLEAARIDAVRARGDEPFSGYQVPKAALALRQGFGRLIRSRKDTGLVMLGDVRVLTKGYGRAFLESLPPVRRFTRFDEVKAFWSALRPDEA